MDPITQQTTLANGGKQDTAIYVDDVFSVDVYRGTGNNINIDNGIDLTGGGCVWIKRRDAAGHHYISGSLTNNHLLSPSQTGTGSSGANAASNWQFNSNGNGFTVLSSAGSAINASGGEYVAWTFKKQPGFFTMVEYTGNGNASDNGWRNINHDLEAKPGLIVIKNKTTASNWVASDRTASPYPYFLKLHSNDQRDGGTVQATPGYISLGGNSTFAITNGNNSNVGNDLNLANNEYVAYIWAMGVNDSDAEIFGTDGNEAIIKCGTYSGNSSSQLISTNFKPQWTVVKSVTYNEPWIYTDKMRKVPSYGLGDVRKFEQDDQAEANGYRQRYYGNGFAFETESSGKMNGGGHTYFYMAIRAPHKPPKSASEVFQIQSQNPNNSSHAPMYPTTGDMKVVDSAWRLDRPSNDMQMSSRYREPYYFLADDYSSATNGGGDYYEFDHRKGWGGLNYSSSSTNAISYMFSERATFYDFTTYRATSSQSNPQHGLGVAPELIIVTQQNTGNSKWVYHASLGASKYMEFTSSSSASTSSTFFRGTAPTANRFYVGGNLSNINGGYGAELFASVPGICKIGSYTGSSSDVTVDCGFTNGARFVLIKRSDGNGNWMVFDTLRGINSGNEEGHFFPSLSSTSTGDYIDPHSSGFTAVSGTNTNVNGGNFIYMAIA